MYYFTIVIFNTLQQVPLEFKAAGAADFCKDTFHQMQKKNLCSKVMV